MTSVAFLKGLGLGASLIMAIGSQNAHVLRMGLLRQHVGATVLVCIVCDMLLIAAGVAGMGVLIQQSPLLLELARWGGAAFLFWYGLRAWRAVLGNDSLAVAAGQTQIPLRQALLTVLAMTLLNPHVYLDTVLLVGSIGAQQPTPLQGWFVAGASSASMLWFSLLGFGARWLAPWFARPRAWQVLDGLIGLTMWVLAALLARHVLAGF